MKTSSYTLIPSTTFGTANGNYDPLVNSGDFSSDPVKAAAYYSKDKSVQTLSWYLIGITAVIEIEATLDADQDSTNYFTIHTIGDGVNPLTENDFINLEGNYTWVRASVTLFTAGTIQKISIGY